MSETRLTELRDALRQFVAEREWERFHDPKNLAMLLASEVGELLAELRWIANHEVDGRLEDPSLRTRVAHEIGDVTIALLLLCDRVDLNPVDEAFAKLELNRSRYPLQESRGRAERP
jgi:NTP pyrophosphatase (non-canonical NTP hydrolase)